MQLTAWLHKHFHQSAAQREARISAAELIDFRIVIVEFSDNVESSNGEIITRLLNAKEGLSATYYDDPFPKTFLNLESRTLFDLIDRGQALLDRTHADVLVWGYREGDKIRLNFQTEKQYENEDCAFVSLLDSLYIPADSINAENGLPQAVGNLIYGAAISSLNTFSKEKKIHKRYLLKKIINQLSKDNSAKTLSIDYLPYIMNFLGIIYLSYCFDNNDEKDFKIVKNLFETALRHQDLIKNPIHLGCIYYHLGQLYDTATQFMQRRPSSYYREAINNYRLAQKYLSKYNYPYDYGFISYKLSQLFFNYWKQKDDIQALRDAVFQLREAEKIYTYALFPEFWAEIQNSLGYFLSLLGSLTKSEEICELAIASYKNRQKVITERRDPLLWASIQEKIGDIYYHLSKENLDKDLLEEALDYFHDALYIFENAEKDEEIRKLTASIAKTSQLLSMAE